MSFLGEFTRDPVAFANKYALTAPGPGRYAALKDKVFTHSEKNLTGFQVEGTDRVCWFDIGRKKGDETLLEIQMQSTPDQALPAAYWLPWAEDQIIRTALRPSRKVEDGPDPNYFFTAPLTGCSVFVEGPRNQPTVYHANAKSHGGTFATSLTKKQFVDLQRAKVEEMEKRYAAFSTQKEKQTRGMIPQSPGDSGREASMLDYMSRAHSPHFASELEEVVLKATKGKHSKIEIVGQTIKVTIAEGTVFGVREEGEWTFYFQKRVFIQHLVNDYQGAVSQQGWLRWGASWLNPVDWYRWVVSGWRVQSQMWLPITCREFWPGGDGEVVLRYE